MKLNYGKNGAMKKMVRTKMKSLLKQREDSRQKKKSKNMAKKKTARRWMAYKNNKYKSSK